MAEIDFQNLPSTTTPLNASNMNQLQSVIDSGSNTYGSYMKFKDGTAIQWGSYSYSNVAITNRYGNLYYALPTDHITLPIAFINNSYNVQYLLSGSIVGGIQSNSLKTSYFTTRVFCGNTVSEANYSVNWLAIGKWK